MSRLHVNVAGVEFKNPIIAASGAFGFGREYGELYDISKLGGISCKGTTLNLRQGNPPPRIAETPCGMLNSVGLQNPGVAHFIAHEIPWLRQKDITIIANIAGSTLEDYIAIAEKLDTADIDMLELNISCPNVKEGGIAFGTSCNSAAGVTKAVRQVTNKPLIVKLSPNVTSIGDIAAAVEAEGADAVSLINTITGMRVDVKSRRPILKNNTGGLSGPAVFPVALRMVWEVHGRVNIPIIGMGGISSASDVLEMMLCGAAAVQIGTAIFTDPFIPIKIAEDLDRYLQENGILNIAELTGQLKPW